MHGEEQFNAFREALRERNWYYWSNSNDDYTLTDSHQGEDAQPLPILLCYQCAAFSF